MDFTRYLYRNYIILLLGICLYTIIILLSRVAYTQGFNDGMNKARDALMEREEIHAYTSKKVLITTKQCCHEEFAQDVFDFSHR